VTDIARAAPLLVTAQEAADILGVGRTKLYELINRGALRPVHIGRSLRLPVAELERFVEGLRSRPPSM
jgi:excisionase family DNA binding protein